MPLVSLDHVAIAFGHLPLLDDVSLQVEPGERVCVIGRNGAGKSVLLQIIGPGARRPIAAPCGTSPACAWPGWYRTSSCPPTGRSSMSSPKDSWT